MGQLSLQMQHDACSTGMPWILCLGYAKKLAALQDGWILGAGKN